jgi:hypothetical protein
VQAVLLRWGVLLPSQLFQQNPGGALAGAQREDAYQGLSQFDLIFDDT